MQPSTSPSCAPTCAGTCSGRRRRPRTTISSPRIVCGEPILKTAPPARPFRARRRNFHIGLQRFHRARTPTTSPPPPMPPMTAAVSGASSRISSPIVAMAGDEIMIVERMNEGAFDARDSALVERLPRDIVGHGDETRAERLHPRRVWIPAQSRSRRQSRARPPSARHRRRPARHCRR